jgi:hypothetical protein
MAPLWLFLVVLLVASSYGQPSPSVGRQEHSLKTESLLRRYGLDDPAPKQVKLPGRLSEASGLAFSSDGRLFCHNDEEGVIHQIDLKTGASIKEFRIGRIAVRADFEGIAIADQTFYMVTSSGTVFEFEEGTHKGWVPYVAHKTFLNERNDVEGLEFDLGTRCLFLACKGDAGRGYKGSKTVYAFSLDEKKLLKKPRMVIPLGSLSTRSTRNQFNPSGIALNPKSGTYFIISATGHSIIEVTERGEIVAQSGLPRKGNRQPEGIAFAPDLSMVICNDMKGGSGILTVYPFSPDR